MFGKLHRELLMATLGTLLATFIFYLAGKELLYYGLDHLLAGTGFLEEVTNRSIEKFQEYVTQNSLASTDSDAIYKWIKEKEPVSLALVDEGAVYENEIVVDTADYQDGQIEPDPLVEGFYYDIQFVDKTARIY